MEEMPADVLPGQPIKGKKFMLVFGIIAIVMYAIWVIIALVLSFYSYLLGILGSIFFGILGHDLNLNIGLLQVIPQFTIVVFFLLSLLGLIFLLSRRWRGFYIYTLTQLAGSILLVLLMYYFPAFWLFGIPSMMLFNFFPVIFVTQVKHLRK